MATYAARRTLDMAHNAGTIVAIELLAAAQGIDLRRPLKTSAALQRAHANIRGAVRFLDADRYMAPDIERIRELVFAGAWDDVAAVNWDG